MEYSDKLVRISDALQTDARMYSLILLSASRLLLELNGVRCWLDGRYLCCFSCDDGLSVSGGTFEAVNLQFAPVFYNVNLTLDFIEGADLLMLRDRFGFPDFRLFKERTDGFLGVIPVSEAEYGMLIAEFAKAAGHIDAHETDGLWSCRTRSEMISILRIAESARMGEHASAENEAIRYIRDNVGEELTLDGICKALHTNRTTLSQTVKTLTGMTPMRYVLEERLNQSRPDLLFTQIPIRDVAERCGFPDVNYYIRAFGKRYGKTPLQYRIDGVAERIREIEKYVKPASDAGDTGNGDDNES